MEKLHQMKSCLESCALAQMDDLANADAHELGEVIDMIKDLEEAMYYHAIRKSMGEAQTNNETHLKKYTDKASRMQELERYTNEVTSELLDAVKQATPEEKAYLVKKVTSLHSKISE